MVLLVTLLNALRKHTPAIAFAFAVALACIQPAASQGVVALVNGEPITGYDVEQRTKLIQAGAQKAPSRKDVIEELVTERLKIQLLKRYAIESVDKDVENAYNNMARRMRQTPAEFTEQLAKIGVKPETLKSRMKADIVWSQIIRGRYQSSFQFSDKEIQTRLKAKNPDVTTTAAFDYTLRPILFIVPRDSPPAAFDARAKEAETLRSRFTSCEQGIPIARSMPYVAVRASTTRNSADLPPALREILTKTELGHLTPPETTAQGVEVYAVCGRKASDNAPEKKEIRDQLFNETFEAHSKAMLKELRSQAMIEYR